MRKWTPGYRVVQLYLMLWQRIYYRKVSVLKPNTFPPDTPVIYAPNHRNALMDALAVIGAANHQPYFLARADIFKKKLVAKILNRMKILPVYRIRDGAELLSKNEEVFDNTVDIFNKGAFLGIFPEASHSALFRMRQLKKGVPRVAFIAEEKTGFKLNLHIVPVGLNYSEIHRSNAELVVHFGDPIRVADYRAQFEENTVKARNLLRDKMKSSIGKLIIDVKNEKDYDFVNDSRWILQNLYLKKSGLKSGASGNLTSAKTLVRLLEETREAKPDIYQMISESLGEALNYLKKNSIEAVEVNLAMEWKEHGFINVLLLIGMLPFMIVGTILFGIPNLFMKGLVRKKVKDICFQSTFYFAGGWILFTIWLAIFSIIASFYIDFAFGGVLFYALAVFFGWLTMRWYGLFRKLRSSLRVDLSKVHSPELISLFNQLISE
jgi:1-acyl-sn-glycerol-3-phosphate acyltransferase